MERPESRTERRGLLQVEDHCMLYDVRSDQWEMNDLSKETRFADEVRAHDRLLREQYESEMIPGRHFDRN